MHSFYFNCLAFSVYREIVLEVVMHIRVCDVYCCCIFHLKTEIDGDAMCAQSCSFIHVFLSGHSINDYGKNNCYSRSYYLRTERIAQQIFT